MDGGENHISRAAGADGCDLISTRGVEARFPALSHFLIFLEEDEKLSLPPFATGVRMAGVKKRGLRSTTVQLSSDWDLQRNY
jgi:hypothetical protein